MAKVTFSSVEGGYQDVLVDGVFSGRLGPSSEVWVALIVPGEPRDVAVARFKYRAAGYKSARAVAKAWCRAVLAQRTPAQIVADLKVPGAPSPGPYGEQFGFKPFIKPEVKPEPVFTSLRRLGQPLPEAGC